MNHKCSYFCMSALALALSLAACGDKTPPAPASSPDSAPASAAPAKNAAPPVAPAAESAAESADAALARRVKAALMADPALAGLAIDVKTSGGVATLFGTADTRVQRRKAQQIAAGVEGVKAVKDEMVIVSGS